MEGIIDDEFVKHLDAFNIQGIARERMLAMSQEDRQVLLAKWKRGSSFAPPTQTAPPRVLSSLPRSNSGRSIDSDVSTGSNPRPAPPRTQSKSKLMPQKKGGDTKMNLNIALHYVLDSLNVTEETRHQVFTQTTEEQKQQIVQKYFNRIKEEEKAQIGEFADNGSGSENVDPISEFDAVKYIDEMPEDALDQELELAFSDPDMNITGDAGSNLIRNMSEGSKRHFLKQFVRKKNEGEKAGLRKSSQKSQRSVVEERPVTGTPSDDSSLWRQPPEFFLKNISRKHESLRLLERDLVNLRIHLSLATSDGINSFLDCEVDVDGMTQTWSDSLDAALSRLTFSTTKSSSYRDIVNIGELRLSALQSLSILINHGKAQEALLSSFSLLSKITGYLFDFPEPSQSVGQDAVSFIKVKMAVVDVLGSICLFSVDGFRLVLHVLESISDIRRSSSRFLPLVSSILNPS
ncbi:hypothetical protein BC829DRAFT_256244 [Chytridium lagenaria]|nr:hypothetical protein BC829DRAFT_256244 [Chytridium lagenaria]